MQLYINYPLCSIILSYKLHHSASAGTRLIFNRPLPKSRGKKRSEGKRYTHRLVAHLGVQGRSSSSSCWVGEGCMREAWSQLSGVQRVRSPGIRRCWDQCCPCQIIWGSTGKHKADRASTPGRNAQQQGCTFIFQPGLCHIVSKTFVTNL